MPEEVCGLMKARYVNPYTDFGFKKLFGEEANKEIANFTPEQLAQYEESLKTYRDLKGVVDTSYEEGKAEGKIEGKIEMAIELKKKGIDIHIIAAASGLSKEEIEKL
jgi:hypothetical protein